MTRLKLLIAILFALALGTGMVVGMGMARPQKASEPASWLSQELDLTAKQSQQIHKIWSDAMKPVQSTDRRHQFQKEREGAVAALFVTDGQKQAYAAIQKKYDDEMRELSKERDVAFQAAVASTKQILTAPQRTKYDELMKSGFRGSPRHDSRHGAATRHGGNGTQPAMHGAAVPAKRPMT